MKKKTYYKIETFRNRLSKTARITALAPIGTGVLIIWVLPPTLAGIIAGLLIMGIAWFVPWLGGLLMMLLTGPGFFALLHSNWDFWQKMPYYILDAAFFISGIMHIGVSVLGWTLRDEWPLKK